jgi:hypothetical protein
MADTQSTIAARALPTNGGGPAPVIIDLGKKKRKQVKQLKRGEGKLVATVEDVIAGLRSRGQIDATAQPIIIVVERRARGGRFLL